MGLFGYTTEREELEAEVARQDELLRAETHLRESTRNRAECAEREVREMTDKLKWAQKELDRLEFELLRARTPDSQRFQLIQEWLNAYPVANGDDMNKVLRPFCGATTDTEWLASVLRLLACRREEHVQRSIATGGDATIRHLGAVNALDDARDLLVAALAKANTEVKP